MKHISDHVGNRRVLFADLNDNGTIETCTELLGTYTNYPFGLRVDNGSTDYIDRFKRISEGHEMQTAFDLGYRRTANRFMDNTIPIWFSTDPLAGHPELVAYSPYHQNWNNPITYSDPDGAFPFPLVIPLIDITIKAIAAAAVAATATAVVVETYDVVTDIIDKNTTTTPVTDITPEASITTSLETPLFTEQITPPIDATEVNNGILNMSVINLEDFEELESMPQRERMDKGGGRNRSRHNQVQNRQVDDLANKYNLSKDGLYTPKGRNLP